MSASADEVIEAAEEQHWVYSAHKISEHCIAFVVNRSDNDNGKNFQIPAEHGWRVGLYEPDENGDTWVMVPIKEADVDE